MKANARIIGKDEGAQFNTGAIIGIMIVLVIGVALVATVADEAKKAQDNASVTGATDSLLGIISLVFVALLVVGAANFLKGRSG